MPELRGTRCTLRRWRMADAESLVRHANNINVAQQLRDRFPHPYSRANAHAFLKSATAVREPSNMAIEVNGECAGSWRWIGTRCGIAAAGGTTADYE